MGTLRAVSAKAIASSQGSGVQCPKCGSEMVITKDWTKSMQVQCASTTIEHVRRSERCDFGYAILKKPGCP